jgi:glycosyltransferase involved in cell wall biosynthesis
MSVRIGIDFRAALAHPCGIARYARELSRGLLALRQDLELMLYASTRFGPMADRIPRAIREHPRVTLVERRLPARALRALSILPGFNLRRITGPMALLHHTDLTFLPASGIPEVVTVHDLAYEVSEGFHGPAFRESAGRRVREAVSRARRIIVPSETTRRDLRERYGVEDERIRVVPHGVDHMLRKPEDTDDSDERIVVGDAARRPYLLFVGTIEPRKNLVRLLQAFALLRQRRCDVDLVLAGPRGWMTEDFDLELRRSPVRPFIHYLGSVPELNLRDLYRRSRAVVYPSLYEGYGLPVVEAMALGVPVITSDRSSTREVAAGGALLVDPEDVSDLAGAMEKVVKDRALAASLGEAGRCRTAALTWKATAQATWEVYREVLMGVRAQPGPPVEPVAIPEDLPL